MGVCQGREDLRVRVDGQLTFNTSYAMIDATLQGYGIAYLPEDLVDRHIASGCLMPGGVVWSATFFRILHLLPQQPSEPARIQSHRRCAPIRKILILRLRLQGMLEFANSRPRF